MGLFTSNYTYYYYWYWYKLECLEKGLEFLHKGRPDQIGEYYVVYNDGFTGYLQTFKSQHEQTQFVDEMVKRYGRENVNGYKVALESPDDKLSKVLNSLAST